jgi:hypothetical protein
VALAKGADVSLQKALFAEAGIVIVEAGGKVYRQETREIGLDKVTTWTNRDENGLITICSASGKLLGTIMLREAGTANIDGNACKIYQYGKAALAGGLTPLQRSLFAREGTTFAEGGGKVYQLTVDKKSWYTQEAGDGVNKTIYFDAATGSREARFDAFTPIGPGPTFTLSDGTLLPTTINIRTVQTPESASAEGDGQRLLVAANGQVVGAEIPATSDFRKQALDQGLSLASGGKVFILYTDRALYKTDMAGAGPSKLVSLDAAGQPVKLGNKSGDNDANAGLYRQNFNFAFGTEVQIKDSAKIFLKTLLAANLGVPMAAIAGNSVMLLFTKEGDWSSLTGYTIPVTKEMAQKAQAAEVQAGLIVKGQYLIVRTDTNTIYTQDGRNISNASVSIDRNMVFAGARYTARTIEYNISEDIAPEGSPAQTFLMALTGQLLMMPVLGNVKKITVLYDESGRQIGVLTPEGDIYGLYDKLSGDLDSRLKGLAAQLVTGQRSGTDDAEKALKEADRYGMISNSKTPWTTFAEFLKGSDEYRSLVGSDAVKKLIIGIIGRMPMDEKRIEANCVGIHTLAAKTAALFDIDWDIVVVDGLKTGHVAIVDRAASNLIDLTIQGTGSLKDRYTKALAPGARFDDVTITFVSADTTGGFSVRQAAIGNFWDDAGSWKDNEIGRALGFSPDLVLNIENMKLDNTSSLFNSGIAALEKQDMAGARAIMESVQNRAGTILKEVGTMTEGALKFAESQGMDRSTAKEVLGSSALGLSGMRDSLKNMVSTADFVLKNTVKLADGSYSKISVERGENGSFKLIAAANKETISYNTISFNQIAPDASSAMLDGLHSMLCDSFNENVRIFFRGSEGAGKFGFDDPKDAAAAEKAMAVFGSKSEGPQIGIFTKEGRLLACGALTILSASSFIIRYQKVEGGKMVGGLTVIMGSGNEQIFKAVYNEKGEIKNFEFSGNYEVKTENIAGKSRQFIRGDFGVFNGVAIYEIGVLDGGMRICVNGSGYKVDTPSSSESHKGAGQWTDPSRTDYDIIQKTADSMTVNGKMEYVMTGSGFRALYDAVGAVWHNKLANGESISFKGKDVRYGDTAAYCANGAFMINNEIYIKDASGTGYKKLDLADDIKKNIKTLTEKLEKLAPGLAGNNTTSAIRQDDRGWFKRNIVDNIRAGFYNWRSETREQASGVSVAFVRGRLGALYDLEEISGKNPASVFNQWSELSAKWHAEDVVATFARNVMQSNPELAATVLKNIENMTGQKPLTESGYTYEEIARIINSSPANVRDKIIKDIDSVVKYAEKMGPESWIGQYTSLGFQGITVMSITQLYAWYDGVNVSDSDWTDSKRYGEALGNNPFIVGRRLDYISSVMLGKSENEALEGAKSFGGQAATIFGIDLHMTWDEYYGVLGVAYAAWLSFATGGAGLLVDAFIGGVTYAVCDQAISIITKAEFMSISDTLNSFLAVWRQQDC